MTDPASKPPALPPLGLMAVDLGVQGSFVANQARIYAIDPAARSRMSGQLFLIAYLGAAACSAVIIERRSWWPDKDSSAVKRKRATRPCHQSQANSRSRSRPGQAAPNR